MTAGTLLVRSVTAPSDRQRQPQGHQARGDPASHAHAGQDVRREGQTADRTDGNCKEQDSDVGGGQRELLADRRQPGHPGGKRVPAQEEDPED